MSNMTENKLNQTDRLLEVKNPVVGSRLVMHKNPYKGRQTIAPMTKRILEIFKAVKPLSV